MGPQTKATPLLPGQPGVLVVVLTHRRGCALAAIETEVGSSSGGLASEPQGFGSLELSERLRGWLPDGVQCGQAQVLDQRDDTHAPFRFDPPQARFWQQLNGSFLEQKTKGSTAKSPVVHTVAEGRDRCAWLLTDSPSAESLWQSYRSLLAALGKTEHDVSWLGCARGPTGSFTGLRIGASFCAGLLLGRQRPVLGVPTFAFADLARLPGASPSALWDVDSGEEWGAQGSEYASPVSGCELMLGLALVLCVGCDPWQNLQVGYSAEPGPVLKQRAGTMPKGSS